ncbi:MAG: T9SS type A sorting domain-containing protein [Bacteroidetes bacterium]|nr:T9SS type A sorting domain-containing protein [Bacteroidota bacterium]
MTLFLSIVSLFALTIPVVAQTGAIPATPGPISGQTNVCAFVGSGEEVRYSIDPVPGASLYLWTIPPTATLVSGQGSTEIVVTFSDAFTAAANKQIRVRSISQAGNSTDRILYLTSQQPSTPDGIAGPSNACVYIGTGNHATYSTAKDPSATAYIWAADPKSTLITHPNGTGVNDTIIHVVFKNGFKSSPVTVQAVNHCGFSAARILTVSGSAPSTPGPISGPTNACPYMLPGGITATYTINPVAGATAYTWITPPNAIVTHPNGPGNNDITITVQYPSDFTGGTISVIANSGCDDSSPRNLNVGKLNAGTPGVITPLEQSICPDRQWIYKLPSMPSNATAINWTVPADAISVTGQGSATISVQYPATRVTGIITATATNNCSSSAVRQASVNLNRCQVERMSGNTGRQNGSSPELSQSNTLSHNVSGNTAEQQFPGAEELKITVAPNPSRSNFKLQVYSNNNDIIKMRLLDLQGRELKKMNVSKGQSVNFGNELKAGTYILEVSQGRTVKTEKLLKM